MSDERKAAALERLEECAKMDQEKGHIEADRVLLKLIGDSEIADAYNDIPKWYA